MSDQSYPQSNNNQGYQQKKPWNNNQAGGQGGQGGYKKPFQGGGGVRFHNTLAESKLRLSAEKVPGANYKNNFPSQLSPWLIDTNPRLVVRPNIEGEREEIIIRMDPISAEIFFNMLILATRSQPGFRNALILKNKDKETNRVYDETRVVFGRHQENGVVYMEVTPVDEDTRLKVTFNFASRVFTELLHGDGVAQSPGEVSVIVAAAWANRLNRLYDVALMTQPIKKKPWQGNNQQQGQGQQGNQGYQKKPWNNNQQQNNQGQQSQGYQQQQQQPPRTEQPRPQYGNGDAPPPSSAPSQPAYMKPSTEPEESFDEMSL